MTGQLDKVVAALRNAHTNPTAARNMIEQPVTALKNIGLRVPSTRDQEVAKRLPLAVPEVHGSLKAVANGQMQNAGFVFDQCVACEWVVAIFYAAIAGAILALPGVTSGNTEMDKIPEIVDLAHNLGVPPNDLVGAISGVGFGLLAAGNNAGLSVCQSLRICS